MPNFIGHIVASARKEEQGPVEPGPCCRTEVQLADGELEGDEAPPLLGEAAGDVTTGPLGCCVKPLPNQFQRVKPKNSNTSTSSAISAAAMPAPAPAVSPLVSTISEPAGLQYLRTL
jgi:hypothetical protein